MPERHAFEYVVIRVVPRIERGECLNAGVVLICRPKRFLSAKVLLDHRRLLALAPGLNRQTVQEIERQLALVPRIAAGDGGAGPIAALGLSERWHWLASPSSTMIQPGPVHTGLLADPVAELEDLFGELVLISSPPQQS